VGLVKEVLAERVQEVPGVAEWAEQPVQAKVEWLVWEMAAPAVSVERPGVLAEWAKAEWAERPNFAAMDCSIPGKCATTAIHKSGTGVMTYVNSMPFVGMGKKNPAKLATMAESFRGTVVVPHVVSKWGRLVAMRLTLKTRTS